MDNLEKAAGEFLGLVGYIHRKFLRPAEQITRAHLSPGQFHAISILCHKGPLPMSELAGEMRISKQQLTPLICKLIENHLVVRKPDDHDRRIVHIDTTDAGKDIFKDLCAETKLAMAHKFSNLPDSELHELGELITRIHDILQHIE